MLMHIIITKGNLIYNISFFLLSRNEEVFVTFRTLRLLFQVDPFGKCYQVSNHLAYTHTAEKSLSPPPSSYFPNIPPHNFLKPTATTTQMTAFPMLWISLLCSTQKTSPSPCSFDKPQGWILLNKHRGLLTDLKHSL